MASELKKYKRAKDVPRPAAGGAAMFIHVLPSGEEVLSCIDSEGQITQVMDAESTKAQLEALNK